MVHGQIGEDFAVEIHFVLRQFVHQLGISRAIEAGGGVDTNDPQRPEVALLVAAITIGELTRAVRLS